MGQITIDTGKIIQFIVAIFAIIGLCAIVFVGVDRLTSSGSPTVVNTVQASSNQPTTISYPSVLTFTVLSTTTSLGRYQVLTTNGNILYFNDYTTWNEMRPRSTYTATLVGTEGSAYQVGTVVLISNPYDYYSGNYYYGSGNYYYDSYDNYYGYDYHNNDYYYNRPTNYPTYWHYNGRYYQCDKTYCDPMNRKQMIGETVYEGRPPRPLRSGANY